MSSQPEPEWDETERAWMLALDEYRRTLQCSIHGGPLHECDFPGAEFAYTAAPPARCHLSTAIKRGQKVYMDGNPAEFPEALRWSAMRVH